MIKYQIYIMYKMFIIYAIFKEKHSVLNSNAIIQKYCDSKGCIQSPETVDLCPDLL